MPIGENPKKVNDQRDEFARNVFAMGDATGFDDLYNGQEVKRTVNDQVYFSKIEKVQDNKFNIASVQVILRGSNQRRENLEIQDNKINGQEITKD